MVLDPVTLGLVAGGSALLQGASSVLGGRGRRRDERRSRRAARLQTFRDRRSLLDQTFGAREQRERGAFQQGREAEEELARRGIFSAPSQLSDVSDITRRAGRVAEAASRATPGTLTPPAALREILNLIQTQQGSAGAQATPLAQEAGEAERVGALLPRAEGFGFNFADPNARIPQDVVDFIIGQQGAVPATVAQAQRPGSSLAQSLFSDLARDVQLGEEDEIRAFDDAVATGDFALANQRLQQRITRGQRRAQLQSDLISRVGGALFGALALSAGGGGAQAATPMSARGFQNLAASPAVSALASPTATNVAAFSPFIPGGQGLSALNALARGAQTTAQQQAAQQNALINLRSLFGF